MAFKILLDGKVVEYQNFDDIPQEFDNVISFKPDFIPPPHTPEEHDINSVWETKLKELMSRERK